MHACLLKPFPHAPATSARSNGRMRAARALFPMQIAEGLSCLGPAADGARPAFLRLTIAGTELSDAAPLARCAHVREVLLPENRLTCLAGLGGLRALTTLDVSGNELTRLLDLGSGPQPTAAPWQDRAAAGAAKAAAAGAGAGAPPAAGGLREADFGRNRIRQLPVGSGLAAFTRLERLVLDGNQVTRGRRQRSFTSALPTRV
jgi:hypothetical protein